MQRLAEYKYYYYLKRRREDNWEKGEVGTGRKGGNNRERESRELG